MQFIFPDFPTSVAIHNIRAALLFRVHNGTRFSLVWRLNYHAEKLAKLFVIRCIVDNIVGPVAIQSWRLQARGGPDARPGLIFVLSRLSFCAPFRELARKACFDLFGVPRCPELVFSGCGKGVGTPGPSCVNSLELQ